VYKSKSTIFNQKATIIIVKIKESSVKY